MSALRNLLTCDSRSEMEERLRLASRSLLIGADAQSPRAFYLIEPEVNESIRLGLCVSNQTPQPRAVSFGAVLLVGHDQSLTWIDVQLGKVTAMHHLEGVFYDFVQHGDQEIGVIHELGALKVRADGTVCWTVATSDVIEGFAVEDARLLRIDVTDSDPVRVSLADGRKI